MPRGNVRVRFGLAKKSQGSFLAQVSEFRFKSFFLRMQATSADSRLVVSLAHPLSHKRTRRSNGKEETDAAVLKILQDGYWHLA